MIVSKLVQAINNEDSIVDATEDRTDTSPISEEKKALLTTLSGLKINQLRSKCKKYKLPTFGTKDKIAERIADYKLQKKRLKTKKKTAQNNKHSQMSAPKKPVEKQSSNYLSCPHYDSSELKSIEKQLFNPSLWLCERKLFNYFHLKYQ